MELVDPSIGLGRTTLRVTESGNSCASDQTPASPPAPPAGLAAAPGSTRKGAACSYSPNYPPPWPVAPAFHHTVGQFEQFYFVSQ